MNDLLRKFNLKNTDKPLFIVNAKNDELSFFSDATIDTKIKETSYDFILVFGTSQKEIEELANQVIYLSSDDGLFWIAYPKKSSKKFKNVDCNRDTLWNILVGHGYEPVRNISINDDYSAIRYRETKYIKSRNK